MTEAWFYNPGDHYVLDDLSGFKVRRSKARTIPGGQTGQAVVDRRRWEAQQPQDFVRGVADDQTVDIARPRQRDCFTVVGTVVTGAAGVGANGVPVAGTFGFSVGDRIQIMLDRGENFVTDIVAISGAVLTISPALPGAVGGLGDLAGNMVLQLPRVRAAASFVTENGAALATEEGRLLVREASS
ncbi:hypothetical protein AA13595_2876 [Gluconacetobacter johannae DSM 13595]|uniref:hypothetical protein n=1 Tax=Gluconacetobacter johannae TaxID=112140 RepID=UPI001FE6A47C|nr:hypothetical protein [Gluconacetobacter johannae]GBQ90374.1 hypothetical protein AA13595_2876 [Gluconacetobacter johannae DSM 13595]